MPIYTPALDLIVNLADKSAAGLLTVRGSRVVAGVSPASSRIVLGETALCSVRAVVPNLYGERAFDDVDLSTSVVRIALGVPGEDPYCLATLDSVLAPAPAVLGSPQSATESQPATKRITLDPAPYGGSFLVTLDANPPFELPYDAGQAQFQALAGPPYLVRKVAENAWEISGTEPGQDVTVAVDVSGLLVPSGLYGDIALNTTALAAAFAAAGNPKWLRVTREVEIDGVKVFQDDKVEIARAVLDLTSLVPTPLPPSDVAAINTALAGKQPINAGLTSIAALTTTAWGRALLTLADAGALRTYASAQPLNSGLTAIASLSTASYGRGVLTQPDAAALRSYIGNSFANLSGKPTTIAGYGITDLNSLGDARWTQLANLNSLGDARWVQSANLNSLGDARWSALGHAHAFADLTSKPTTVAGYGITDLNSLGDARWSALAHTHTFSAVTGKPTTIAGYGITDAIALKDAANSFSLLQTFNALASSGITVSQLANPGAPTVTAIGNDEGATWSYKIVARLSDGTPSAAGPAGTTTHGDQTLDATNKNSLTWTAVPGAVSYDVYRTAHGVSPSTNGKIANVLTNAYVDTGAAGDSATPPTTNATGKVNAFAFIGDGSQLVNLPIFNLPSFTINYSGVGDNSTLNDASFTSALASGNASIYLPEGTYQTSLFSVQLADKRWVGPGRIVTQVGTGGPFYQAPSFTWLGTRPSADIGSDPLHADLSKVDVQSFILGDGVRTGLDEPYFEYSTTPHVQIFDNRGGSSGLLAQLASPVAQGVSSMVLTTAADVTVGMLIGFNDGNNNITDRVTVLTKVGATITFSPPIAAAGGYPAGAFVTNSTRTMNAAHLEMLYHRSRGDSYIWCGRVVVSAPALDGHPHIFNNATGGIIGGDLVAAAEGVYLTPFEFQTSDAGHDIGVITVQSFNRTNNTGARGAVWIGHSLQSQGTVPMDVAYSASGLFNIGLDFQRANFGANACAIGLGSDQYVYFNNSFVSNAGQSLVGNVMGDTKMGYNSGVSAWELVVGGLRTHLAGSGWHQFFGATLGNTAGNTATAFTITQPVGSPVQNNSNMRWTAVRNSTGLDFTTASHRIQNDIDGSKQGYLEFNASGALGSLAFGVSDAEVARFVAGYFLPVTGMALGSSVKPWKQLFLEQTLTLGGTTGTVTINKTAGSARLAAGSSSVLVGNNLVTANSIVIPSVQGTTPYSVSVVAGSGIFTLYISPVAAAETEVRWLVLNQ